MNTIKYDFSDFNRIMRELKTDQSPKKLNDLKDELNTFFKDSKCNDVIYTINTDKLFFGMCVMPIIDGDKAISILQEEKNMRIDSYYLELDSKLFDIFLNLSSEELVAILLHEVGHIVNTNSPVDELRKEIDSYLIKNNEVLVISDSIHYKEILAYAIKDSIRRIHSMFENNNNEELLADEFVYMCGYGKELESAFSKIIKNNGKLNKEVSNKFIVLKWTLSLYKDVKHQRISAIKILNRGKSMTSSKLEVREMENVIRRLNRIDDDSLLEATISLTSRSAMSLMKYKGMKALENEAFEFAIRLKTLKDEDTALVMIRQINYKMSIIDEYIRTEIQLDEKDKERWFELRDTYDKIRHEIMDKNIYSKKTYGIWIEYPEK